MRVRWRQVAELAGVSEATVSRVMNGRAGVTDRTKEIVLRAVDQLGATLPPPSRRLRAGLVGIVVPELDNPVFPAIAQRVETRLAAAGYTSVIGSATMIVDEQELLWALAERGVDGIVVVSGRHANTGSDHATYVELLRQGTAMVFVNGYAPDVPAPFVSCDDRRAAALAVSHLVALGHRRIGFVSGPARYVVVQRKRDGFVSAVAAAGADPGPELVIDSVFTIEGGHSAAVSLIERGATAVVTGSDLLALGTVLCAREHGLAVPGQWSAVGFDDSLLMAHTDPPLTTVRQPLGTITEHACRLLLDQLHGQPATNREFLVRPELVVRGSTAAPTARRGARAG